MGVGAGAVRFTLSLFIRPASWERGSIGPYVGGHVGPRRERGCWGDNDLFAFYLNSIGCNCFLFTNIPGDVPAAGLCVAAFSATRPPSAPQLWAACVILFSGRVVWGASSGDSKAPYFPSIPPQVIWIPVRKGWFWKPVLFNGIVCLSLKSSAFLCLSHGVALLSGTFLVSVVQFIKAKGEHIYNYCCCSSILSLIQWKASVLTTEKVHLLFQLLNSEHRSELLFCEKEFWSHTEKWCCK